MKPRKMAASWCFHFLLLIILPQQILGALIFLQPQSACKVKCQNGGYCAYVRENPDMHKCICFIDTYYGELCQYKYPDTTTTEAPTKAPDHEHLDEDVYSDEHFPGGPHNSNDADDQDEDMVRNEQQALEENKVDALGNVHSDELYFEAHLPKEKTSRDVEARKQHARVYTESPPLNTEFDRLESKEYNAESEDDYAYSDDDNWMMTRRGAAFRPSAWISSLTVLAVLLLL